MPSAINHFGAVTMRITGDGILDMRVSTLDNIRIRNLVGFQMDPITEFEPTRIANFTSQKIKLTGSVNEIDEYFSISTIILWKKVTAIALPGPKNAIPASF